jgi:uroporphyrinogen-III decarboxylase
MTVPSLNRATKPMSSRERTLAALQGKPVDHIPFAPLMDWYTIMDMPEKLVKEAESRGYNRGLLYISRHIGLDIMLRHVIAVERNRANTPFLCALGWFRDPVRTYTEVDNSVVREVLETPVGTLSGTYGFTDRVSWIPHPIEHFVNTHEELKIFHYAMEHLSEEAPVANHENFLAIDREVGEDGIATTSFSNTPLMYLIEMVWGLENTYYMLHDYPDEVEDIIERLHQAQRRFVEMLAESPAQVVINYENTSSTLLSRKAFRKYCLPYLNIYADILGAAGKIYLVHACGKLRSFTDELRQGTFAGMCDIAPPPTGDLPLDEAVDALGDKIVVGGIDATTFVSEDDRAVEEGLIGLIERIKPHSGVMLGSADTAPRGTTIDRFRKIKWLVQTAGSYC